MTKATVSVHPEGKFVRANGIDIHYVEAGKGEPLLLLHGGLHSTDPLWAGAPGTYVTHIGAFAEHFRVIAPDLRGHGKTANNGAAPISYVQLADDALGLIDVLGLDRPMICGFSAGASVATIAAIRKPESVRALVNDAGYDVFNPNPKAPVFVTCRQIFGGRPDATEADPSAFERFLAGHGMSSFLERLKADHGAAQGAGGWKALVTAMFDALTTSLHTFEDLRRITVPTLVLTGDRDMTCTVEEAVTAFRMLVKGELAILPGHGHYIPDSAIELTVDFLRRHQTLAT
jgi:pimeloyl-ACP methyl ester carboxylesterase